MNRSIIFVNRYFSPDHSATSQLLTDLAVEVAKSKSHVKIVTSRQIYDDPERSLSARQTIEGVEVRRVWTTRFGRNRLCGRIFDYVSFLLTTSLMLLSIVRRGDLVIAKTDPPMIGVIVAFIAAIRGARQAHWVQDVFPEIAAREFFWLRGLLGRALMWMRNAALRRAAFIVVLSDAMRRHLSAQGIAEEKFFVIPNWFDGEGVRPLAAESNPLRRHWGAEDKFVVGYSGNLGRVHDSETFFDAAVLLQSEPEIQFCFIGGGRNRSVIEDRVRRRAMLNVRFEPYQDRDTLTHSLTLLDVHLVSLRPGFDSFVYPSKIAAAAAAGRPIVYVGDAEGELARDISKARIGVVTPCGDGAALAQQLLKLKDDDVLRGELGANARQYFERTFARPKLLASWTDLLRRG